MTNHNNKDLKKRLLFKKYEVKRLLLKSMIKNMSLMPLFRKDMVLMLNKLPRNSSLTRVKNRCTITGRGKSIYRKFRMSRLTFRELANKGLLPGIKKSSW